MSRLVKILGTQHELQGCQKRAGNLNDPLYLPLLKELIAQDALDFVFEEATGLGPTIAQNLSVNEMGANRYLDVDPSRENREKFGISADSNEPNMIGSPMAVWAYYDALFYEVHAKREVLWIQEMRKQEFERALMIVGQNHTLSLAFRLLAENFAVKTFTYTPSRFAVKV
jgi:hypothetical protein